MSASLPGDWSGMEALEPRLMLSGDAPVFSGTAGNDVYRVSVVDQLYRFRSSVGEDWTVARDQVQTITVNTGGGSDLLTVDLPAGTAVSLAINGTAGNDRLTVNVIGSPLVSVASFTGDGGSDTLVLQSGYFVAGSDLGADQSLSVDMRGTAALRLQTTQHLHSLRMADRTTVTLAPSGENVLILDSLEMTKDSTGAYTSLLDLCDNGVIVNYDGPSNSPLDSITGMIKSGRGEGDWTGFGISSSTIDSTLRSAGIGERPVVGLTEFMGLSVSGCVILVRTTWAGDADLDGGVTFLDYGSIDFAWAQNNPESGPPPEVLLGGWQYGDFDYDGAITFLDYGFIDYGYPIIGDGGQLSPVVIVPTRTQLVYEWSCQIPGIGIYDGGEDDQTVTLSAIGGFIDVTVTDGLTVSGNGSGTVALVGDFDILNAALKSVYYRPSGQATSDQLTVVSEDSDGASSRTINIAVATSPPTLTISGPSSVNEGDWYSLALLSTTPDGAAVASWSVDWGDKHVDTVTDPDGTQSVDHVYRIEDASLDHEAHLIVATATTKGGASGAVSLPVTVNSIKPTVPLDLYATVNDSGQVELHWTGSQRASSYNIYRSTSLGQETLYESSVFAATFTDPAENVQSDVVYYYTVAAMNSDWSTPSRMSNEAVAVVTTQPPEAPTVWISGPDTISEGQDYPLGLHSAYLGVGDRHVTSWTIDWGDHNSDTFYPTSQSGPSHAYASGDGLYTISAVAADEQGTYPAENTIRARIVPNAPEGLTAEAVSGNEIQLAWTDASSIETGYVVETFTGGTLMEKVLLPTDASGYEVTDLRPGTDYYVTVAAYNAGGSSSCEAYAQTQTGEVTDGAPMIASFRLHGDYVTGTVSIPWDACNQEPYTWSGEIDLTGIPQNATVKAAYVIWSGFDDYWYWVECTLTDASGERPVSFDHNQSWFPLASRDVTQVVREQGNGVYHVTFRSDTPWWTPMAGATLVVIYARSDLPVRQVALYGVGKRSSSYPEAATTEVVFKGLEVVGCEPEIKSTFMGDLFPPTTQASFALTGTEGSQEWNVQLQQWWNEVTRGGVTGCVSNGDTEIRASLTPGYPSCPLWVAQVISVPSVIVDLSIDSDNDDGFDPNWTPSGHEEQIEEDRPGKIIPANDADLNDNGTPDFAEFGAVPSTSDPAYQRFVPVKLTLDMEDTDFPSMGVTFDYADSDPSQVVQDGPAWKRTYTPAPGVLRLWTHNGSTSRTPSSVADGGDYIPAGARVSASDLSFDSDGVATLWLEGVRSGYSDSLKVTVDWGQNSNRQSVSDAVGVTVGWGNTEIGSDLIVVNNGDKDKDGVPDLADGFSGSPAGIDNSDNPGEHFTRLDLYIPEAYVDPDAAPDDGTKYIIRYSASNLTDMTTTGDGDALGYVIPDGNLRIWKGWEGNTRNPRSIADGGDFVASGEEYTAEQLGLSGSSGSVTLYVEAIRGSREVGDLKIEVFVDPGGRENQAKWIPVKTVRLTAIQDAHGSGYSGAVRYSDGTVVLSAADLVSGGFSGLWGQARTITTQAGLVPDNVNGNGVVDLPFAIDTGTTVIIVMGGEARYFDTDGTDNVGRFSDKGILRTGWTWWGFEPCHYGLTEPDGGQWWFNDEGRFSGYVDPAGNRAFVDERTPDGQPLRIRRGPDGNGEAFVYTYYTDSQFANSQFQGLLGSVTLERPGPDNWQVIRKVTYTYYGEESVHGSAGDLESAVVTDGAGSPTDATYYRYFAKDSPAAVSRVKLILGTEAIQLFGGLNLVKDASNEDLGDFADYAFTYYDQGADAGRVHTQAIRGAGGASDGSIGTYTYTYSAAHDQDAVGFNTARVRTHEDRPGGTSVDVETNFAGQVRHSDQLGRDQANLWATSYTYDNKGRLTETDDSSGVAHWYDYFDSSDPETPQAWDGYLHVESISVGRNGTKIPQRELTYYDSTPAVVVHTDTVYEDDAGQVPITITYDYYGWWYSRITQIITHLPAVPNEHNGAGDATVVSLYDTYGRLVDTTDAGGITTTFEYDDPTGQVVATTIHGASGLTMASTNSQVNDMGRPVVSKDSAGHVTTIYGSSKMDSPKAAVTPSVGPSQVTSLTYSGGQGISTTSLHSPTVSNGGILASSQSIFDRGGRVKAATVSTPGGSFTLNGTSCTYDAAGRLELAKDVTNTVTKMVYDDLDRPVDILQAVSTGDLQSVGDGDLRKITHYDYDRGNLWKVTQYAGNDSSLTTVMGYDGRNRLISTTGPDGVRTRYTWDNLGRQTSVATYDSQNHCIATTDMHYDERGQVYQTEEYGVSLGQARVTKYWHDADGRVWKTQSPEGLITETEYDGLGRVKETRLSGADDSHCLLQNTTTDYDAHGNVILTSSWQYGEGEAVRGSYVAYWYDRYDRLQYVADYGDNDGQEFLRPNTPPEPNTTDNAIVTKYLYDSLGRQDRTIDNKGRVTQTVFDALGRQVRVVENCTHTREEIIDAPGGFRPGETESDTNRTTAYVYDSAGRLHELIAYNPKGSGQGVQAQVTSYSHDDPTNGDLTTDVLYPTDTSPVHFAYDRLGRKTGMTDQRGTHHRYEYDSAGRLDADRVLSFAGADDAVTAITCEYDAASRLKSVSSLDANGNVMNQVLYTYDDWGNVATEAQSHSGPADEDSPATQYVNDAQLPRLNELIYPGGLHVYYNHDVNSRVADIASSTQPADAQKYVAYAYLGLGTIVKVTHPAVPGGLTLDYGEDGSAGLDRFGRVVYHAWTQQAADETANVIDGYAYGYDRASNRLYRRNVVNPAFSELYGAGGADPQRQYDGLDRLVGFQRGTLRADNRSVASADSTQSWQLDSLGNWSSTTTDGTTQDRTHGESNEITSIGGASTTVDYDAAGNMTRIPVPGAETTAYYLCTYDAWNRLTGVFHDDGNTAGQLDSADTLVAEYRYDGLNRRIAKIIPLYADSQNPANPTGYDRTDYLFNLDWQVLEERFEGNVGTDLKDTPPEAVHVQYVWDIRYIDTPVLRIRDTAGPNGPDGALDAAVDEVVYYLTDANMNVTALVDGAAGSPTAGQVVERYMYDAYGKATILNGPADADNHPDATTPSTAPDWSADADQKSDLGNVILFAGYPLDPETGMYLARNRYLQPTLGRWTSVDPKCYEAGMNLFAYCEDGPTERTDPYGRDWDDYVPDWDLIWKVTSAVTGNFAAHEAAVQALAENGITPWDVARAAGKGAKQGITCDLDYLTLGKIESINVRANDYREEAKLRGDTLSQVGYGAGEVGIECLEFAAGGKLLQLGAKTGLGTRILGNPKVIWALDKGQYVLAPAIGFSVGWNAADGIDAIQCEEYERATRSFGNSGVSLLFARDLLRFPGFKGAGPTAPFRAAGATRAATIGERVEGVAQRAFDYAVDNPRVWGLSRTQLGKDADIQATRWLRRWAEHNDVPLGPGGLRFRVRGAHSVPDVVFDLERQVFDFKLSPASLRAVQTQNIINDFPGYDLRYIYGPELWR